MISAPVARRSRADGRQRWLSAHGPRPRRPKPAHLMGNGTPSTSTFAGGPWCGLVGGCCTSCTAEGQDVTIDPAKLGALQPMYSKTWVAPVKLEQLDDDDDDDCWVSDQLVHATLLYSDGSSYKGQTSGGLRHGEGTLTAVNGGYVGQWRRDVQDGRGIQTWDDTRCYEGSFQDGMLNGCGRMEWKLGDGIMVYEGEYWCDLKHGHGVFTWPDGRRYDGQWVHGKRSGRAAFSRPGIPAKVGLWVDDKLVRWLREDEQSDSFVDSSNEGFMR